MRTTLLCLHGWGGTKESFTELRAALEGTDNLEILTPDLPGFGDEPEPPRAWTNDDYAAWVEEYVKRSQLAADGSQLFVVAHSHGGRIAMKMAVRGNVKIERLFLCASAGIRSKRHFKRILGLTFAKIGKVIFSIPGLHLLEPLGKKLLYKLVRVHDYEKASPLMRQTLINVTREDFRPLLPVITQPTDIFWGEDDRMTPVADGKLIAESIPNAHLQTYPGVRHAVHRAKATEIADIIKKHL